jgi:hypothetical protein
VETSGLIKDKAIKTETKTETKPSGMPIKSFVGANIMN